MRSPCHVSRVLLIQWLIIVLLLSASADAFDGKRKGFVAGASLGYAPETKWRPSVKTANAEYAAFGMGFVIGQGISNRSMILLAGETLRHNPKILQDTALYQVFFGPILRYYFSPAEASVYCSVGGGFFGMGSESQRIGDRGLGYRIGLGYEFYRRISLSVIYIGGETTSGPTDFTNSILAFRLNLHLQ